MSRPVWPAGHYVSGLCVRPSVRHTLGVPLCVQRPAKTMPFQQIIMHALQCQHDVDVHLLFCFDLDLHPKWCFNLDFLRRSSLMGTTLHAVPSKSHAFSTNEHACAQNRCTFCFDIPIFNLFPSSCITFIFFVDSRWWVPLCPTNSTISTNYVYIAMPIWYTCTPILFWPL